MKPQRPQPPSRTQPASKSAAPNSPDTWGPVAAWYDQLVGDDGSEFHQRVILPGVTRLLRPHHRKSSLVNAPDSGEAIVAPSSSPPPISAPPMRIVDLACGQGVLCRKLASLGHHVVGVDIAEPLLHAARQRQPEDGPSITYVLGDATKLPLSHNDLPEHSFDAVTLVLAVQNLAPLSPVWEGVRRLLVPSGMLIMVMMHPCFRIPQHSDWHWNEQQHRQDRTIASYLSSLHIDIQTHPGRAAQGQSSPITKHYHRPLQAYINTLATAGLHLDRLEEWASHKQSQPGIKQAELDRSRKEIPMFLAVRARSVG